MLLRHGVLLMMALLFANARVACAEPWVSRSTDFGPTAVGTTSIPPNTLATRWNVLAIGLFCVRSQPHLYLYGIGNDRVATAVPVRASIELDGIVVDFTFWEALDAVSTPVPPQFLKAILAAKNVSVQVKDYNSPNPDVVDMANAPAAIRTALRTCYKP